jgi:hypothetical protein
MSYNIDLKELQRKAMSSFHEDGIIDIIIGILALIWGFSAFTDDQSLSVIWIAVVIPSYWWLKREYTIPRIGMVRFQPRGEGGFPRILVTALVGAGVAIGLAIWWASAEASKPFYYYLIADYWGPIAGVVLAISGSLYAYTASLPRFYTYSALALILIGTVQYSGLPFGVHLLALGAIFLGYGCYLLYKFMRKYPVQAVDGQDG